MSGEYRTTLRLTDAEHAKLQDQSDNNPECSKGGATRVRFPKGTVLRVEMTYSDGTRTLLQAPARDLSENGIGIYHNAYVHTGVGCGVTLRTVDGESVKLTGRVTRCIHLRGAVHEVGVRLEQRLDPSMFVSMAAVVAGPDYQAAGLVVTELQSLVSKRAPEAAIRVKVAELLRSIRAA